MVFLEISQNLPVPESLFNKVAGLRHVTFLKKRLWHRCFPMNFAKLLRTPFLKSTLVAASIYIHLFNLRNWPSGVLMS